MTSFGHSKPCQKTMYIYTSLSLIISLIKLMNVNYAYNNKKNLTWIFMKGTGCYSPAIVLFLILADLTAAPPAASPYANLRATTTLFGICPCAQSRGTIRVTRRRG